MSDIAPAAARAPRWMKLLLAASLGLNLLVVGAVLGRIAGGGPPPPGDSVISAPDARPGPRGGPSGGRGPDGIGPIGRALSREDRRAIGQALRAERDSLGATREQMRAGLEAMAEVLRTTPFARADMAALMQQLRASGEALAATGETLLLDRLDAMSDAERAAFADRLMQGGRRR